MVKSISKKFSKNCHAEKTSYWKSKYTTSSGVRFLISEDSYVQVFALLLFSTSAIHVHVDGVHVVSPLSKSGIVFCKIKSYLSVGEFR